MELHVSKPRHEHMAQTREPGVVLRSTGNRKQRPHSLYISALENCMISPSSTDTKNEDEASNRNQLEADGFIKAEVITAKADMAKDVLEKSEVQPKGILD